nr:MAG TPA: hypothetical protein [Caudoviricetes sp.]
MPIGIIAYAILKCNIPISKSHCFSCCIFVLHSS